MVVKKKLNTRRETAMSHGFRKFFDTTCTNSGMDPIYIEFCLGHSLQGVKDSYFLPQPDSNCIYLDILEGHDKSIGYIDAIDYLTINQESRLRRENETLKIKKSEKEQLKEQVEKYKNIESEMDDLRKMCFTIVDSYRKVIVEDDKHVIQGMKEIDWHQKELKKMNKKERIQYYNKTIQEHNNST
jgi:hypothetical protein